MYKIGDIYKEGNKSGIIVSLDSSKCHGIIMSLDEAHLPWCEENEYKKKGMYDWGGYKGIVTGALDNNNGIHNCDTIIRKFSSDNSSSSFFSRLFSDTPKSWKVLFPALYWCKSKGNHWYIPAINEWKTMFESREKIETIDSSLKALSAPGLISSGESISKIYWASNEGNGSSHTCFHGGENLVFCISQNHTQITSDVKYSNYCEVRGFAKF